MDYLVELKVSYKPERLFVRVLADSAEEAVEKAEIAWGYDALSVGKTPNEPNTLRQHSSRGMYRQPVVRETRIFIGEEKL